MSDTATPGGNYTDRDLGLYRGFDPKSLQYPIEDVVSASAMTEARTIVSLAVHASNDGTPIVVRGVLGKRHDTYLSRPRWDADQGNTPRCTGFAGVKAWLAHRVTTKAYVTRTMRRLGLGDTDYDSLADLLYLTAVQTDREVHGWTFDGGATMLALGKAGVQLDLWKSYHWGTGPEHAVAALLEGDVPVLGVWWRTAMDAPSFVDDKAYIVYEGAYRGGHAICMDGDDVDRLEDAGRLDQTWGEAQYGVKGHVRMGMLQLSRCLADDGEVLLVKLT